MNANDMSAQPVDVLAVMDTVTKVVLNPVWRERHAQARAEVAELIVAVEAYREADNEVATSGYGPGERHLHAKAAAAARVDAALARIGVAA